MIPNTITTMTSIPHFHPKTENTTIYQATAASCGVLNPSWNKKVIY